MDSEFAAELVLGLKKEQRINGSFTKKQINGAYKTLSLEHHPDKGGDAGHFRAIKDARDRLLALRETTNTQSEQQTESSKKPRKKKKKKKQARNHESSEAHREPKEKKQKRNHDEPQERPPTETETRPLSSEPVETCLMVKIAKVASMQEAISTDAAVPLPLLWKGISLAATSLAIYAPQKLKSWGKLSDKGKMKLKQLRKHIDLQVGDENGDCIGSGILGYRCIFFHGTAKNVTVVARALQATLLGLSTEADLYADLDKEFP